MGEKKQTRSEFSKSTLIDFLYIDKGRVDSLISQLRSGTLRSVTKTIGTSGVSSFSANGGLPQIAGATYGKAQKDVANAAEKYDPYHSQIIDLLNDLSTPPLTKLPDESIGQLVILRGDVTIRDMRSIKMITPTILKNQKLLKLPTDKTSRDLFHFMDDLIQQMDDAIQISIQCGGMSISGTLLESGLSIRPSDLNRTYGTRMPGNWYVLGILDSAEIRDSEEVDSTIPNSFEDIIDVYTDAIKKVYSAAQYAIIPVLIYREIQYSQITANHN